MQKKKPAQKIDFSAAAPEFLRQPTISHHQGGRYNETSCLTRNARMGALVRDAEVVALKYDSLSGFNSYQPDLIN